MKALLVGNGAREHIIAERLSQDADLYCLMSKWNPAIARLSKESWLCDIEDPAAVAKAIEGRSFDLGFASPDATLAAGVSDVLEKAGMAVASPSKAAARIEWDKSFMRGLLESRSIKGSPRHRVASTLDEARAYMKELGDVAIKPLGLTGGKGVKVSGDHFTGIEVGLEYADSLIRKDGSVLIEEKIVGEEFTLQAFCDGVRCSAMPPVQDHKRAYEGDRGPNTGGMGSYSTGPTLPFLSERDVGEGAKVMQAVIDALRAEGAPFRGILYGQFMATAEGVKVVEFNARFGDPEAMNVLSLLKGSLSAIFESLSAGKLKIPSFSDHCTVVKYLVPEGYPERPLKDAPVTVNREGISGSGAGIYYASVYEKDGRVLTTGSRAFGIVGKASTLEEAESIAERACGFVKGPLWHRADIGRRELIERRMERMRSLRGTR
jgi:phosphoribosylamine--glycine ligase